MNRQKAEGKGIGRRHRRKEVGIGRNGQVKEIGRARKQAEQGKKIGEKNYHNESL